MHKWRPKKYSFVFVLIRPTSLVLKELFFCILSVLTRLVMLICTKTIIQICINGDYNTTTLACINYIKIRNRSPLPPPPSY